jgi:hypothetical protein
MILIGHGRNEKNSPDLERNIGRGTTIKTGGMIPEEEYRKDCRRGLD